MTNFTQISHILAESEKMLVHTSSSSMPEKVDRSYKYRGEHQLYSAGLLLLAADGDDTLSVDSSIKL